MLFLDVQPLVFIVTKSGFVVEHDIFQIANKKKKDYISAALI